MAPNPSAAGNSSNQGWPGWMFTGKDSPDLATVRTLTRHDIPADAAPFARVHPEWRWASRAACETYFHEILFENPWLSAAADWIAAQMRATRGHVVLGD